ncbi:MAG: GIY-YIG nuclease family protein [Dehalococcoidia bacterium]|jgi:putative endonuclease|nr:GIY-YIG nuclease family protein [Dehalococcoidia bacterium]
MTPCVYILEVRGGGYYVGSTPNLERRIAEHQQGIGSVWTASRRPVRVVYTQEFPSLREAFEAERQLKGWRREKKAALIRGDWESLPGLADTRADLPIVRGPQDEI